MSFQPTHDTVSPWIPEQDPRKAKPLGKLLEELGECTAAAARCLIQGIDGTEPETGRPNREWLEAELADVLSVIAYAQEALQLRVSHDRMATKLEKFRCWHRFTQEPV